MNQETLDIRFRRAVRRATGDVTVEMDGRLIVVGEEDTVAAAILLAGALPNRLSAVSGSPRTPFCMMGACFECLAEIDGVPLQQTCLVQVAEGMRIRTARGSQT